MPTIGANVETVTREGTNLCMRDVGGCDRIRPLWKHYYSGCQVLFFFFDITDFGRFDESMQELAEMLSREELRDTVLCVIANKQDLSTQAGEQAMALGVPQITIEKLRTDLDRVVRDEEARSAPREIFVGGAVATTGEGLEEAVSWMIGAVQRQRALKPSISSSRELLAPAPVTHQDKDGDKKETGIEETKDGDLRQEEERNVLEEWLEREDAPDDDFLDAFARYDLESWDHYTHLRVAWLFLRKHGRREGIRHIFDGIKLFIANSTRTQRSRGTTFHETMTYFWVHMVHFARESATIPAAKIDFKSFLLLNPQLSNGGLFLTYYSKKLILQTEESRVRVVLPDLKPLPSLLCDVSNMATGLAALDVNQVPTSAAVTDAQFVENWEKRAFTSWGHEHRLRLMFVVLSTLPRREATAKLFEGLKDQEKDGHNETETYFWISIVTLCIAKSRNQGGGISGGGGIRRLCCSQEFETVERRKFDFQVLFSRCPYQRQTVLRDARPATYPAHSLALSGKSISQPD
eukprot:CAMPEP_0179483732 /NCGR_PEP_ID=MMETSP0799-20121207/60830_1 /TAXON_ID=46947 /ORGANISM="Geminigera cryophila, Strain CCMP2564" /LENGTH=519 /DNA_ID=CAMNT_0021297373 /DNA_START=397 /DNA_END=1956 /DNA_ORIENTATION=-